MSAVQTSKYEALAAARGAYKRHQTGETLGPLEEYRAYTYASAVGDTTAARELDAAMEAHS